MNATRKTVGYLTLNTVPHPSAASLNILMMLDGIMSCGHTVTLYAPSKLWRSGTWRQHAKSNYPAGYSYKPKIHRAIQIFPFDKARLARKIVNQAFNDKIDVLYIRNREFVPYAVFYQIPFIVETHAIPTMHDKMLPFDDPYYKKHIVLTRASKDAWIDKFPSVEKKIFVEPDAISICNIPHSAISSEHFINARLDKTFKVGYFGGFSKGKGAYLIPRLARSLPNIAFFMYGGGLRDLSVSVQDLPTNLYLGERLSHKSCLKKMQEMDVLLLPNNRNQITNNGEDIGLSTSPIKLFEYIASYRPIVASEIPAVTDVLTKSDCLMCQPEELNQWVAAIKRLYENPLLCYQLASSAFQKIKNYTFTARFNRIFSGIFN